MAKFAAAAATLFAVAEAKTLAVTWEDCGAKHAKVTDLEPTTIKTGSTETLTGTGALDKDVTGAHFSATVSAKGVQLTSCEGDATTDIVCKLPLGAGTITVKKVAFPLKKGTVSIPVDVKTSSLIPASLDAVDVHIAATDQDGDSAICLDVHTKKQELEAKVQGGSLAVTWEDCGAKHAKVTDLEPTTIKTGSTETLTGTGALDKDVTAAHFSATVSAKGVQLTSCEGDATTDIVCKLPLGAGTITVKKVAFPLKKGTVSIPVDVKTSSLIPASLDAVDVHIAATDQDGDSAICLDVHTKKQELEAKVQGGSLAVTWEDCGAKHAKVTDLEPTTIKTGSTETLTGTGALDKDVTGAHFSATVSAKGVQLTSCEGDATTDIECKLPLGAGTITVKKVAFPLKKGTVSIPVDVKTSSLIPASLAAVDVHIAATDQDGDSAICLDVHTKKQELKVADRPDCSTSACDANCECSYVKCSDQVDACLAVTSCAASQDCAFTCACGDGACLLKCAARSPSLKALTLAKCITSNCDGSVMV